MTTLYVEIDKEYEQYLDSSARIRNVSRIHLVRAIMKHVLQDQLILSILDDDDKPSAATEVAPRRAGRPCKSDKPPADRLFNAVTTKRPTLRRPDANTIIFRRSQKPRTRAEYEAELREAVENTARLPVE